MHGRLERLSHRGIDFWTDPALADAGIMVAFTQRAGGVSRPPFGPLNLAAHVGDDPESVDTNRDLAMDALGIGYLRERLVTAVQVHGDAVAAVGEPDAGRGAFSVGAAPVADADGLVTMTPDLPLMLLFADCVPIVLVDPIARAVGVVHAGWRGALAEIPARGVNALVSVSGATPSNVCAYIGAHVGPCCYEVDERIMSQFSNTFVTVSRAEGHLDLGAAVTESLTGAGVLPANVIRLDACTADASDQFFSYRKENGVTGRHGAFACLSSGERPVR